MSGNSSNRAPADPSQVNVNDPAEVKYRRKQFGCTEQQLRQAVSLVGTAAAKVGQYLKNKSKPVQHKKLGY